MESIDLRGKNTLFPGTFTQVAFRCTDKTEIYYRNYLRFQAAFAYIGGMIQALILIGKCFVYFFSKNSMLNYLFINILSYEEMHGILNENLNINLKGYLSQMNDCINQSIYKLNSKENRKKTNFQELNLKSINFNSNSNIIGNDILSKLKINDNIVKEKNDLNINLQNIVVNNENKKQFFDKISKNEIINKEKIIHTKDKNNIYRRKRNFSEGISDLNFKNQNEMNFSLNKNNVHNNFNVNVSNQLQLINNNSNLTNLNLFKQNREKP